MCYCDMSDEKVIEDFIFQTIPDDALRNECCWAQVCEVRGRNPLEFDAEYWTELCRHRGHVRFSPPF
jgi:hypothetical protein